MGRQDVVSARGPRVKLHGVLGPFRATGHGSKPFWYHFGIGAPPILEPILVGCSLGVRFGFDPWPTSANWPPDSKTLRCPGLGFGCAVVLLLLIFDLPRSSCAMALMCTAVPPKGSWRWSFAQMLGKGPWWTLALLQIFGRGSKSRTPVNIPID